MEVLFLTFFTVAGEYMRCGGGRFHVCPCPQTLVFLFAGLCRIKPHLPTTRLETEHPPKRPRHLGLSAMHIGEGCGCAPLPSARIRRNSGAVR